MLHKNKKSKYTSQLSFSHLMLIMCMMISLPAFGQQSLVCKTSLQLSLNQYCEVEVKPNVILKNYDRFTAYSLVLKHSDGEEIAGHVLTMDHIGLDITAEIKNLETGVSCWSKILVESKIFPDFSGCADLIIPCKSYPDTLLHMPQPEMTGTQCGTYTMSYDDRMESSICAEDGYNHTVYRTWTLVNQSNHSYSCTQRIFIKRQTIENIYFPPHYNNVERKPISCDYILDDDHQVVYDHSIEFYENGTPSIQSYPYGTGAPGGDYCENIKVNFHDTEYPSCGNQRKILRKWNIIDWCTSREISKDQVIELVDDRGPVLIYSKQPKEIPVEYNSCYATLAKVPFEVDVHDCSETSYSLGYKYKLESGKMSQEILSGIHKNDDDTYRMTDVPGDSIVIVYHVSDACGHTSTCEMPYKLVDKVSPVAVCEKNTVVTLNESGLTELWADKIQHYSVDNCKITRQEIRRKHIYCEDYESDTEFGEKIRFCCNDVGSVKYDIELRVFDDHGNYADCHIKISIQDKIKPYISECPSHKSISCHADYSDIELMGGHPAVEDNCGMQMDYTDDLSGISTCGFGIMQRTWKATDFHGNWSTCIQEITIEDENPLSSKDIIWPRSKTLADCETADISSTHLGEPEIPYKTCSQLAFNYEDQILYGDDEFCMKVLRNWSVIDWCNYDPGATISAGYWSHTQVIKFKDLIKPVIASDCKDITTSLGDNECQLEIQFDMLATDNCSQTNLNYTYDIDVNGAEQEELTGQIIKYTFPKGSHSVVFSAMDGCGNSDNCAFNVDVTGGEDIGLICLKEISLSLGATGETEIWASDFVKDVFSVCTESQEYEFSFADTIGATSISFSCLDFAEINDSKLSKDLLVYAISDSGKKASCTVDILITDNFNHCQTQNTSSVLIGGKVALENKGQLANKMVYLENMSDNIQMEYETSEKGEFAFENLALDKDYQLTVDPSGNALEGVSTLDLIQIQKHILGKSPLDSPYKIIAADIDQSNNVSVTDLIYLRNVILGIETNFPSMDVWRFVDREYGFIDPKQPWNFSESVNMSQLHQNKNLNITAMKIGDVNQSYQQIDNRELNISNLEVDIQYSATTNIEIHSIRFADLHEYVGFQFSFGFNPDVLELVEIKNTNEEVISDKFYTVKDGKVKIAYSPIDEIYSVGSDDLLHLVFRKTDEQELHPEISLDNSFNNELYPTENQSLSIHKLIQVNKSEELIVVGAFPNPFNTLTTLQINSMVKRNVHIDIYQQNGKLVFTKECQVRAGTEFVKLNLENLLHSDFYYCRVSSGKDVKILKLFAADNNH